MTMKTHSSKTKYSPDSAVAAGGAFEAILLAVEPSVLFVDLVHLR